MKKIETKTLGFHGLELKMDSVEGMKFSGFASVFGGVDDYGDTIAPGAYAKTLVNRKRPIMMLYNHYGSPVGKWTAMREDEKGLYIEGELTPNHSKAADVYASMKHGTLGGMSIGYYVRGYETLGEGRRLLKEIELVEVSVVDQPADISAVITDVKSALDDAKSLKEIEALLRDAGGFSRSEACALVARIKSLSHREDEAEKALQKRIEGVFANVITSIK